MPNSNWKNLERKVANDLGVSRVLQKGLSVPDVKYKNIIIECKNAQHLNLKKAMEQLESYRENSNEIMVLVFKETNKRNTNVFMKMGDLKKLLKNSLQKADCLVSLDYKDFIEYARKYKTKDTENG